MNIAVMDSPAEKALFALALKYEVITGKQVKWRKDTEAAFQMVMESLSSSRSELFQAAVTFLEAQPLAGRKAFLRLQQETVPDGFEARIEMYRGVAFRQLRSIGLEQPTGDQTVVQRTYRGVAYEEPVTSQKSESDSRMGKRFYRGQRY
ncbi:hypothetical protein [Oceanobacter sp. 4_MG-2023]|uniref:hypothetical protein n=1 Tax=Oceanobacter sp. 4_MG-2023 TaxID=3062623 RepID=UPI0027357E1E|nr:hypothetical protein [Oceanobacter sp. 4_MG-2023]MDP2549189.1 hypothetical protein [Oceanobacter sp. 4_MG-2023]